MVELEGQGALGVDQKKKKGGFQRRAVPPLSRYRYLLLITQHAGSDWRGVCTEQGSMEYGKGAPPSRGNVEWMDVLVLVTRACCAGSGPPKPGADVLEEWIQVEFLNDVASFEILAALSPVGNPQQ